MLIRWTEFVTVGKPRRFFNVGRVFKVLWSEPASANSPVSNHSMISPTSHGQFAFTELRRFVVIRERSYCSLCLSINTYGGQATTKLGVRSQDHAVVFPQGELLPSPLPGESMDKAPFPLIIERLGELLSPLSRLDFSRIYTVEHNIKVMSIGRIPPQHLKRLDHYFTESIIGEKPSLPSEEETTLPRTVSFHHPIEIYSERNRIWVDTLAHFDESVTIPEISKELAIRLGIASSISETGLICHMFWRASRNVNTKYNTAFTVVNDPAFDILLNFGTDWTQLWSSPTPSWDSIPSHPKLPGEALNAEGGWRISGTPGETEKLDPRYRVRNAEYKKFFRSGRVFSMLLTLPNGTSDEVRKISSIVQYGGIYTVKLRLIVAYGLSAVQNKTIVCLPITNIPGLDSSSPAVNPTRCSIYSEEDSTRPSWASTFLKVDVSDGERLPACSEVLFEDSLIVESNVKVMDVGTLDANSLESFHNHLHTLLPKLEGQRGMNLNDSALASRRTKSSGVIRRPYDSGSGTNFRRSPPNPPPIYTNSRSPMSLEARMGRLSYTTSQTFRPSSQHTPLIPVEETSSFYKGKEDEDFHKLPNQTKLRHS